MTVRAFTRLFSVAIAWSCAGMACGCGFDSQGLGSGSGSSSTTTGTSTGASDTAMPTTSLTSGSATSSASSDSTSEITTSGNDGTDTGTTGMVGELDDEGLVSRWFVDESSEQIAAGGPVDDAAPNPLPLGVLVEEFDIDGGVQPVGSGTAPNRGVRYFAPRTVGRVRAPVSGTKIEQRIHGATALTLELVVDVEQGAEGGARLVHFGLDASEDSRLALAIEDDGRIDFRLNGNTNVRRWPSAGVLGGGRRVLHLVLDSTRVEAAERVRFHVDGELREPDPFSGPPQDVTVDLQSNGYVSLFNRTSGERSFVGVGHYAAVYDVPFDTLRIERHVAALQASDDEP
jgi:hypothetical protein